MRHILKNPLLLFIAPVLIIAFFITTGIDLITDWLWFESFGYEATYMTILLTQLGTRLVTAIFLFVFFFANLMATIKMVKLYSEVEYFDDRVIPIRETQFGKYLKPKVIILIYLGLSALLAYMFSGFVANEWHIVQKFLNAVDFGTADPIFNQDISFYIFTLPFYQLIYSLLITAVVISAMIVGAIYFLFTPRENFDFSFSNFKQPQVHLTALLVFFFLLLAWNYRLSAFGLLLSTTGAVFGAGYTDVHARLFAFNVLSVISIVAALALAASIFVRMRKLVFGAVGLLIVSSVVLGGIYPSLIERFQVQPNQFAREQEYLEHNIQFTRMGYNLDQIKERQFDMNLDFSPAFLEENQGTLNNVRLWDWRPLRQTYEQLQGLRPYYEFNRVNMDRYNFDGDYRQVMLGARELNQARLPERAQTWQNLRLRYTHGYGLVMSPVNEATQMGQPEFFIRNIPPQPLPELNIQIERPEIYFGELTTNFVVVNSLSEEFSYPSGTENVYTHYQGQGGVQLDSFAKKALYALRFGDFRLMLSGEITPESRILYDRDIETMVNNLAPFLRFDRDPYLVLSEGKLYWIRDAYTVSNRFPYSEPTRGWGNYVRNSVKVVIDAYEGDVDFYIADADDPIIKSYSKIFPDMFKPLEEMPKGLQEHIRYPVDFFSVQAHILSNYHMENSRVFYNREDAWTTPVENYRGQTQMMAPYYTILQIPGEEKEEYVLMLPFTPERRQNMVSWFAARNDGENYGELILYRFPRDELVYGPAQINARIEQDSEISQQLTLWDQRGSSVFRGNMMVLPVGESVIYVEPLFLQAEQSNIPELARVIVAYGDLIVMEETLEEALDVIFGTEGIPPEAIVPDIGEDIEGIDEIERPPTRPPVADESVQGLIRRANQLFTEAQERSQAGDWAGYGEKIEELQEVLEKLEELSE